MWLVLLALAIAAPSETVARLSETDPRARILAARALAADESALEPLAAALAHESDPAVRRAMTDALARLPLTEDTLLTALHASPEPTARAYAAHALAKVRSTAAAMALLAAMADPSPFVRQEVYAALGAAGDRAALAGLSKAAVRDPVASCRDAAAAAAEQIAGAPTVPPDVTADIARLRGGSVEDRVAAARRLGAGSDRRAFDPLIAAVGAPEPEVARAAIAALGRLGDARAVTTLLGQLSVTGKTRYAALGALAVLRDESSADPVAALLRDPDPASRQLAVRALSWIAPDDLFARLDPAVRDPIEDVRGEVLRAIEASSAPTRIAPLRTLLADPSPFLRAEAVRLCADAGVLDRIPTLLQDDDPLVRLAAADAIAQLRPEGAAATLRAAAKRTKDKVEREHVESLAAALEANELPIPGTGR